MTTTFTAAEAAKARTDLRRSWRASSQDEANPLDALTIAGVDQVKRNAALREAADITPDDCELYRDTHYSIAPRDLDDPVRSGAVLDFNDDATGKSGAFNPGCKFTKAKPTPRRSLRNLDLEHRSRRSLREDARHDPGAFRAALPWDILDRLLLVDGDDVPNGPPVRHPTLAPTWPRPTLPDWFFDMRAAVDLDDLPRPVQAVVPGDGKFMVAPRPKQNVAPGLAIGAAEIAAEGDIPTVNVHGVMIGLRRADKAAKPRRETLAPLPKPSWSGRRYGQRELMAFGAGRGMIPSFLAGITIAA